MSKVLVDTNVLLDFAVPSRPQSDKAVGVIGRCAFGEDEGFVSVGSLKDFYYVFSKHAEEKAARDFVRLFLEVLEPLPIDGATCREALDSDEPDFEDGIIRALAENRNVNFIITRDASAFSTSTVRSLDPSDYIALFGDASESYAMTDW